MPRHALNPTRRGLEGMRFNGRNSALQDSLYSDADSRYDLAREQPHHRQMVELSLRGYTIEEIAAAVGRSRVCVRETLRQPWARERLITRMKTDTYTEMRQLLEGAGPSSIKRIIQTAENEQVHPKIRLAADAYIVDHLLGRATQPITTPDKEPNEKMSDEELQRIASGAVPIVHVNGERTEQSEAEIRTDDGIGSP